MTVCIAARSGDMIVAASDRMVTAGDVQFEPPRSKIIGMTNSIMVMTAGDASYTNMILRDVTLQVQEDLRNHPDAWMNVSAVVDHYVHFFNERRSQFAATALLAPLGLTRDTFLDRQQTMDPDIVRRLTNAMIDYTVADCAVIIAGRDTQGTHIYTVHGTTVNAHDGIGFVSVGIGSRHADSQFMLNRHTWNGSISDTLLLAYVAKRRSEVAPGVGEGTDMAFVGPALGTLTILSQAMTDGLELEYQKIITSERAVLNQAKGNIADLLEKLSAPREVVDARDQNDIPPEAGGENPGPEGENPSP